MLVRIVLGAALFAAALFLSETGLGRLYVFWLAYAVIGYEILWLALRNILHGEVFDENFLMSVASIGALILGQPAEAVAVMLFYTIGELFQSRAVEHSRQSIAALMDIRPDYANIESGAKLVRVDPQSLSAGDVVIVLPGERVPLDGEVIDGASALNTASLTGESLPRTVGAGDKVISGCINLSGPLRVRVDRPFAESTVSRILDLVENSSTKKARVENFITRFARVYTPAVVGAALVLAVAPPLLFGQSWAVWVERALIFLVVSCPCALVISVPLSFFGGIGGASRQGILVKGSNYLEALAQTEIVVFDKTGTLTKGVFRVTSVHPAQMDAQALLELAALAENFSGHPIARSIREACQKTPDPSRLFNAQEILGLGTRAVVDGKTVYVGSAKLMVQAGVAPPRTDDSRVHVAADGVYAGYLVLSDEFREDAVETIKTLDSQGIATVILTGDRAAAAGEAARHLGVGRVAADLLPEQKVAEVEKLLAEKSQKGTLVFVGDGINDAPVLSRADVGVAMGGLGSDAAIEAADIVLMDDRLMKIAAAIAISKKTLRIVRQNIVFSLGVKALVLALGAAGLANMWAAVFADVGVSILAILNAVRALKVDFPAA
jgi:Cd2+/Zn2+-exporting ATPase